MKTSKQFKVVYSPDVMINKLMRSVDMMQKGEGICTDKIFTIVWKDGEVVDQQRMEATKLNLRKAIELAGGEVFSVEELI